MNIAGKSRQRSAVRVRRRIATGTPLGRGSFGVWARLFCVALAITWCAHASTANAANALPGAVRFVKGADSAFDRYTSDPSAAEKDWMRAHYWRMRTYSPYFDSRLTWFPNAWVYKDLYAIYVDSPLAQAHPEWILRDATGSLLYIPYDCAAGRCPQYAADIGNAAFRAHWIGEAGAVLAKGYRGLFVDDVNMTITRVANGSSVPVTPQDPRTGRGMTDADWRRYMAEFTEAIRAAFPTTEIVHNALWFLGHDDVFIRRAVESADFIELERGVNDTGLRGGAGTFGFETFLAHIDWLHERGKGVVFDAQARRDADREYGLAAHFLVRAERDALGNDPGGTPDDWWRGFDVDLGGALGTRYWWQGVLRRDFERGLVLVNSPDAPHRAITLDGTYRTLADLKQSTVALGPASGAVLQSTLKAPVLLEAIPLGP